METEEELAVRLVHEWWDVVWRLGDVSAIDRLVADPYVRHTRAGTEATPRAEYKKLLLSHQRTLHRPVTTIDDQAVAGNKVWTRATSRGANIATGEQTLVTWMMVHRIADNLLAEVWAATVQGVDWNR